MEPEQSHEQQDLEQRKIKHQQEKYQLRDPNQPRKVWEKYEGEYNYHIFDPDSDEIHLYTDKLSETESLFLNYLKETLKHRQYNNDPRPVIAVDFGGGWLALSFLKIIAQLDSTVVDNNQIIFISTTLESLPTEEEVQRHIANQKLLQDKVDLVDKYRSKVHFISADSYELTSSSISLSDGRHLDLLNNVSLIHEDYCERHSQVADEDWKNLISLLDSKALVITSSRYAQKHDQEPDQEVAARQKALDKGRAYILKSGLVIAFDEATPYYDIYTTTPGKNIVELVSRT